MYLWGFKIFVYGRLQNIYLYVWGFQTYICICEASKHIFVRVTPSYFLRLAIPSSSSSIFEVDSSKAAASYSLDQYTCSATWPVHSFSLDQYIACPHTWPVHAHCSLYLTSTIPSHLTSTYSRHLHESFGCCIWPLHGAPTVILNFSPAFWGFLMWILPSPRIMRP